MEVELFLRNEQDKWQEWTRKIEQLEAQRAGIDQLLRDARNNLMRVEYAVELLTVILKDGGLRSEGLDTADPS